MMSLPSQGPALMLRTRSRSDASLAGRLHTAHHPGPVWTHPVLKFIFTKLLPQMLLEIEYWRITRQAVDADILWRDQRRGAVRTGAINDQDDADLGMSRADVSSEGSPVLSVHGRADHPVPRTFQRADRSIDLLKLSLVTVVDHWALWRRGSAASNRTILPKRVEV